MAELKVGIIGAGVSGMSLAKLLESYFEVEILEKNEWHGGIARTRTIEGVTYHPVGGHCFNSKFPEVMDFVFGKVLSKDQWHLVERRASIKLGDHKVPYPIEFSVRKINEFDPDLAFRITEDFLSAEDDGSYTNLEDWFRKKFGNTLAELYFIPYNSKIWNRSPQSMSHEWVRDKLPLPDKRSFFAGLVSEMRDAMPHSYFYYPNSNNQNTFLDALRGDTAIRFSTPVESVAREGNKWIVNGELSYDILISTAPLNETPARMKGYEELADLAKGLTYNRVTTMFWRTAGTEDTWTYVPSPDTIFHRYIHVGSFYDPVRPFSITEAVGIRTEEEMIAAGKKDPFLIEPLSYNVSQHAYVVFDANYRKLVDGLRHGLQRDEFYLLGRFGEWEYYNMDICIKKALDLAEAIIRKHVNGAL